MKSIPSMRVLSVGLLALLLSLPALANWNGEVVLSGTSLKDIKDSTLSFSSGGAQVPVTVKGEDDDGNVILGIGFTGDSASAGTLGITGAGGDTKSIALPAAGQGQKIYVDTRGPGTASLSPPGRSAPKSVSSYYFPSNQLNVSFGVVNLTGTDIATSGTVLPSGPGSEYPSLKADYDVDAIGGGLSFSHNFDRGLPGVLDRSGFSSNLTLDLAYNTYSDDNSSSTTEPSGGASTGFLITALEPFPDDQTGANFGPFGIQSTANIDVDFDRFNVGLRWRCDRELPDDMFLVPKLSLGYTNWDVDLTSRDTFEPTFPSGDYFNQRSQSLDQNIYDLGVGATFVNPLGNSGRFDVFFDATAHIYYNDAELDSLEQFNIGQPTIDERQFKVSDDETDIGLDLGIGFGWNVSANWRVTAEVATYLNVPSASIDNPVRGDNTNPGPGLKTLSKIDFDNKNLWGANVGITYNFGS